MIPKGLFFCCLWLIALATTPLFAQDVPRRGTLGLRPAPLSTDVTAQQEAGWGVLVNGILPGSTAAQLGLLPGDVIQTIAGARIEQPAQLFALSENLWAGDTLAIQWVRAGQVKTARGRVAERPWETTDKSHVIYGTVPFRNGYLRSILYVPKGTTNRNPVVFWLQGFGCASIEYGQAPRAPIRQWVDGLVEAGFAVFRVEKPGVGDSQGGTPCLQSGYLEERDAFEAAYQTLQQAPQIDPERMFLFGHSLGGVTAAWLARQFHPLGLITYGTVAKSWFEYLIDYHRKQLEIRQVDYQTIEATTRAHIPLLYHYLVLKETPAQLKADPHLRALLEQGSLGYDGEVHIFNRHFSFLQELQDQDLTAALIEAGVHTLALHGAVDLQAISSESAETIARIVNAYHPGKGTYWLVPETAHGFAKVPTMAAFLEMWQRGGPDPAYQATHFNTELVQQVAAWMQEKIDTR